MAAVLMLSASAPGKRHEIADSNAGAPVLWRDPGDIATRDLFYGPGGKAQEPRGVFTFVEETALIGPVKIPFTCSYLPGKIEYHVLFGCASRDRNRCGQERRVRDVGARTAVGSAGDGDLVGGGLRRFALSKDPDELRFEEEPSDRLVQLGLGGYIVIPGC